MIESQLVCVSLCNLRASVRDLRRAERLGARRPWLQQPVEGDSVNRRNTALLRELGASQRAPMMTVAPAGSGAQICGAGERGGVVDGCEDCFTIRDGLIWGTRYWLPSGCKHVNIFRMQQILSVFLKHVGSCSTRRLTGHSMPQSTASTFLFDLAALAPHAAICLLLLLLLFLHAVPVSVHEGRAVACVKCRRCWRHCCQDGSRGIQPAGPAPATRTGRGGRGRLGVARLWVLHQYGHSPGGADVCGSLPASFPPSRLASDPAAVSASKAPPSTPPKLPKASPGASCAAFSAATARASSSPTAPSATTTPWSAGPSGLSGGAWPGRAPAAAAASLSSGARSKEISAEAQRAGQAD